MKTYIELWKAKPTWENLSQQERARYMEQLGPAIQKMLEKDVEIIAWGVNDDFTYQRADCEFFAVWRFRDTASAQQFEQLVKEIGWYNYFDQVNAMGYTQTPQEIIPLMIKM